MDFYSDVGELGLGSRLKRLSDLCMTEVKVIYTEAGFDFEPRWFPLFRLLIDRHHVTVTEVSEQLGMTHPHVSLLVKELINAKLILSRSNPNDGRSRHLVLTPKGEKLGAKLAPFWKAIRQSVADLVREEDTHFLKALTKIEASFNATPLSQLVRSKVEPKPRGKIRILNYSPKLRKYFEALNREWLEKYFSVEAIDKKYFANPESMILDKGGDIFFAEVDGQVLGTCSLLKEGSIWELAKMAVTESARGQGIGEKLVKEAIKRAEHAEAKKLMLVTNSRLIPAIKLYKKLGFYETFRGQHPKYKRGDVVMEMALS